MNGPTERGEAVLHVQNVGSTAPTSTATVYGNESCIRRRVSVSAIFGFHDLSPVEMRVHQISHEQRLTDS